MKVEYTDRVDFAMKGTARAVYERVKREAIWGVVSELTLDGASVVIRAVGVGHDPEKLRRVENVKARIEELGREAAEYEWLRPMFE